MSEFYKGVKRLVLCIAAASAIASPAFVSPVFAQQSIDEPSIDPIFGKRPSSPKPEEIGPINDDEYDEPQGWDPFQGFVGVLTILVPQTTNLSVGVGPQYRPDYFGSDDYEFQPDPQVYVRFRNFLFFDDDGADLALFGFSGFAFGPSIRIAGRRNEDFNPALQGLGDIGFTLEAGGFVATTFLDRVSFRAKMRRGVAGGHEGWIGDAQGTVLMFTSKAVSASFSGNLTWIDGEYADTFFSITEEQAARSGLPVFDADQGFRDVGGSFNGYVNVGKRWSVNPYVRYRRIFRDIAATPIIDQFGSRNQFTVGFHLMREFQFDVD
ncbi:MAG: MipA/OmpV family protein [Pseudomonadota bacterium]